MTWEQDMKRGHIQSVKSLKDIPNRFDSMPERESCKEDVEIDRLMQLPGDKFLKAGNMGVTTGESKPRKRLSEGVPVPDGYYEENIGYVRLFFKKEDPLCQLETTLVRKRRTKLLSWLGTRIINWIRRGAALVALVLRNPKHLLSLARHIKKRKKK